MKILRKEKKGEFVEGVATESGSLVVPRPLEPIIIYIQMCTIQFVNSTIDSSRWMYIKRRQRNKRPRALW